MKTFLEVRGGKNIGGLLSFEDLLKAYKEPRTASGAEAIIRLGRNFELRGQGRYGFVNVIDVKAIYSGRRLTGFEVYASVRTKEQIAPWQSPQYAGSYEPENHEYCGFRTFILS